MPTVPPVKVAVEIESADVTAILSDWVAVLLLVSVTFAVNEEVPDAVGVPEMTPVEVFRASPAGSEPLLVLQVYGELPPFAWRVAEYAPPTVPFASDDVVIDREDPIASPQPLCAVLLLASVT